MIFFLQKRDLWWFSRLAGLFVLIHGGFAAGGDVKAPCPKPTTTSDVLRCVLEGGPASVRANFAVERSEANRGAVSRLANPTLNVQSGVLSPSGHSGFDHQVVLTQPIDWGGKRGSRIAEADAQTEQAVADRRLIQGDLILETLLKLHRLRQAAAEVAVLDETNGVLLRLVSLYRKRPSLTPEQEISSSIFKTALSEMKLRRLSLDEEIMAHAKYFAVSTGLSLDDLRPILPQPFSPWPSVSTENNDAPSANRLRAEAERRLSLAQVESANAGSWPDLALGPYALFQGEAEKRNTLVGAALIVELPVLSLNAGARAAAQSNVLLAEKNVQIVKKEEASEISRLTQLYDSSVQALSELSTMEDQEKRHEKLEKHFIRGVVPSVLVIESHRQLLELARSRHEREMKAIEAWWKIKALQGKFPEAAL